MRSIPAEIKAKLEQHLKATSNASEEKLTIIATQMTSNTLLSEPIHEGVPSNYGDVALRQLEGETDISKAYAVCIDEGIANIYERSLPADINTPWVLSWSLGAATDVGIEFQGEWELSAGKEWYYLQTELFPYLFWIEAGNLYVQKWKDASTKVSLDTGVSALSVCKGWNSKSFSELDQGLIVGYLKSGKAYYRAYCYQTDGTYLWEPSYQVTELGEGNTYLSIVRTNDFRIGFVTEKNGIIQWTLSHRNYAGMSVRPETAGVSLRNPIVVLDDIKYRNMHSKEGMSMEAKYLYTFLEPLVIENISIISLEKLNHTEDFYSYGYRLYLNKPIHGVLGSDFPSIVSLSDNTKVSEAYYEEENQALVLIFATPIKRTIKITVTIAEYRSMYYNSYGEQKHPFPGVSAVAETEAIEWDTKEIEQTGISLGGVSIEIDNIEYNWNAFSEGVGISGYSVSVQLVAVSNLPI
jgi:hypothetical protein